MKSKMPCLPGLTPVMNDDHAGKVTGGVVERSTPDAPPPTSRRSTGMSPASMKGPARSQVAPSRPTIAITPGSFDVAERPQALLGSAVDGRLVAADGGVQRLVLHHLEMRGERGRLLGLRRGEVVLLVGILLRLEQ